MNLLDILGRDHYVSTKYFGMNDIATRMDVKVITEQHSKIDDYLNHLNNQLSTVDNFTDYLLLNKISKMGELSSLIAENSNKILLDNTVKLATSLFQNFENKDLISYINNDYQNIFSQDSFDIIEGCLELIIDFKNGIKINVFDYIIDNKYFLIIDNYDSLQNIISENDELLGKLTSKSLMLSNYSTRITELMGIAKQLKSSSSEIKHKHGQVMVDNIVEYGRTIHKDLTRDNSYIGQEILQKILSFLESEKNVSANEFRTFVNEADKLSEEQLKISGNTTVYTFPVQEIIKQLEKENSFDIRMIKLTHNTLNGDYQSNFSEKSPGKNGLFDYIGSNIPTDDYFTPSFQRLLDIKLQTGAATLHALNHKYSDDIYTWFISTIENIDNKLESSEDNLVYESKIVMSLLSELKEFKKDVSIKGQSYAASVAICGFIEKLLRSFYYDLIKDSQYVVINKITLGSLISPWNNDEMVEIFNEYHLKALNYFLLTASEKPGSQNKIGFELRNKLAHMRDIKWNDMTQFSPYFLLFLLIDILNTINYKLFPERYE